MRTIDELHFINCKKKKLVTGRTLINLLCQIYYSPPLSLLREVYMLTCFFSTIPKRLNVKSMFKSLFNFLYFIY